MNRTDLKSSSLDPRTTKVVIDLVNQIVRLIPDMRIQIIRRLGGKLFDQSASNLSKRAKQMTENYGEVKNIYDRVDADWSALQRSVKGEGIFRNLPTRPPTHQYEESADHWLVKRLSADIPILRDKIENLLRDVTAVLEEMSNLKSELEGAWKDFGQVSLKLKNIDDMLRRQFGKS